MYPVPDIELPPCGYCPAGQVTHNQVHVSHSKLSDIALPDVNIVHLRRAPLVQSQVLQKVARETGAAYRKQARVSTFDPEPAAHHLVNGLKADRRTSQLLKEDICQLAISHAQATSDTNTGAQGQQGTVTLKLEVLGHTPCPKWHADHVAARLLCSYVGPGTLYLENRFVQRKWTWHDGQSDVAVGSVEEQHAVQVSPWDVLLLKGHAWPNSKGLGAVHRSPDVDMEPGEDSALRLLLTIDDACLQSWGVDLAGGHQHCCAHHH